MKRPILKSVAVIAAFFIGIAISNSCGKSSGGENGGGEVPSFTEMWNAVRSLQSEVAQLKNETMDLKNEIADLKKEVAGLKSSGGGNNGGGNSNGGEFFVDGLWFNRAGAVSSKFKTIDDSHEYTYDNQGRLQTIKMAFSDNQIFSHMISNYSYSGKTVIIENIFIDNSGQETSRSTSTNEYY